MNVFWGLVMAVAGLLMLLCGTMKSNFVIYRMMVARSRISLGKGDAVHRLYQVSGFVIMVLGLLWATGIIWQ